MHFHYLTDTLPSYAPLDVPMPLFLPPFPLSLSLFLSFYLFLRANMLNTKNIGCALPTRLQIRLNIFLSLFHFGGCAFWADTLCVLNTDCQVLLVCVYAHMYLESMCLRCCDCRSFSWKTATLFFRAVFIFGVNNYEMLHNS